MPDRSHKVSACRRRLAALLGVFGLALIAAAPASAQEEILGAASYPDMSTYQCRTDAIPIYPGQNINLFGLTKTCPNAVKVSGPGDASDFAPGSTADGYVTRFKPSMVEVKEDGKLVTPSVWDLHLHHVVWLAPDGGPDVRLRRGEDDPEDAPGLRLQGRRRRHLGPQLHDPQPRLAPRIARSTSPGRSTGSRRRSPSASQITQARIHWLDVAGAPQLYPVFDAERGFDTNGDGQYTFPDEVPFDPAAPGYEEREKISNARTWTLQSDRTLVFGAGHLHPGGSHVDLQVARDGPDPGSIDGDDPAEVRPLFRSDAHYYEPAGPISWDVAMTATRPDWRISLKAGDTVSVNVTYDVSKSSWYESMGILPLANAPAGDPAAKDPFDDEAAVAAMYDEGGILTHGRLPENIDAKARKNLKLPDPRDIRSKGRRVPKSGIKIEGFRYSRGGYSANKGFPTRLMRPPVIRPGQSVTFTNVDSPFGSPDEQQVWHSVTSCKAPCNRGSGIGYPLARGPVKFDSGQLGFGTGTSTEVTTGSDTFTTPPLTKPGTYTYFCRIHPFMRGSVRVKARDKNRT